MGRDEDVIEVERGVGCRYGGVTGVRYCKRRSVADYYAMRVARVGGGENT